MEWVVKVPNVATPTIANMYVNSSWKMPMKMTLDELLMVVSTTIARFGNKRIVRSRRTARSSRIRRNGVTTFPSFITCVRSKTKQMAQSKVNHSMQNPGLAAKMHDHMRRTTPLWHMPTPLPEYHRWPASKYMGWTA